MEAISLFNLTDGSEFRFTHISYNEYFTSSIPKILTILWGSPRFLISDVDSMDTFERIWKMTDVNQAVYFLIYSVKSTLIILKYDNCESAHRVTFDPGIGPL